MIQPSRLRHPPTAAVAPIRTRSSSAFEPASSARADLERLGDEIATLAAHLHAATYRLLERIREFDAREGWAGFQSCAHWLNWRTGISLGPAREKVRVARALEHLPEIGAAMGRGELSYSKVRALTRIAAPDNEAELMDFALHASASQTERLVAGWRRVDRLEAAETAANAPDSVEKRAELWAERIRHESRFLQLWQDSEGSYRIEGRLDPEVGAMLERALEMAGSALVREGDPDSEMPEATPLEASDHRLAKPTAAQRKADALGRVAEAALRRGVGEEERADRGRADRFQVVLHRIVPHRVAPHGVGRDSVVPDGNSQGAGGEECASPDVRTRAALGFQIGDGMRVSAETSRRLSCDASRVVMTHAPDGSVLDVGRRSRVVPASIRRAVEQRDGGVCRFPACGNRYCDAHHIWHWEDGGPTALDNLVLLCARHHRLMHESGFSVRVMNGTSRGTSRCVPREVRFFWPDGRPIPDAPAPPRVPADAEGALSRAHAKRKIMLDAWTAAPRGWGDATLDLGYAVSVVREGCAARRVEPGVTQESERESEHEFEHESERESERRDDP